MAEEVLALSEQLLAEATCPLCLDLFAQPVLTACGHSFCQECLAAVLRNPPRSAACPQCRSKMEPGSLRPNRALGAVAELARSLGKVAARSRCPEHGKFLALFCEACAAPVCARCRDGPEHGQHRVRPAEEAAPELRETLQSNLLLLQNQKGKLKANGDQKIKDLLMMMAQLLDVPKTSEELHQFLKEQEKILMAQFTQLSQELVKKRDEYNSRVSDRKRLLDTVIEQIEKKQDQPVFEFLTDVGKILSSCEAAKAPIPEPVSPELKERVWSLLEKGQLVMNLMTKFRVSLWTEINGERECVTLDPETATPDLILSRDQKTVWLRGGKQKLSDTSRRFLSSSSILASQGFTSGRHFWDVDVMNSGGWAVGVAVESVPRKEKFIVPNSDKVWVLQLDLDNAYKIVPHGLLTLEESLQRITVHLDYEAGQVTFYNAKNMKQVVQFKTTFTEKVFPCFWLWSEKTHIWLCD